MNPPRVFVVSSTQMNTWMLLWQQQQQLQQQQHHHHHHHQQQQQQQQVMSDAGDADADDAGQRRRPDDADAINQYAETTMRQLLSLYGLPAEAADQLALASGKDSFTDSFPILALGRRPIGPVSTP